MSRRKILISELRDFGKKYRRSPRAKVFRKENGLSSYKDFIKEFKTLNNALTQAKLPIHKNDHLSDEDYLEKLRELYSRLGRLPEAKDMTPENNTPHYDSYRRKWGSLENALKNAGISGSVKMNWTKAEVLGVLNDFYLNEGRVPIEKQYKLTKGFPSSSVFRRLFGGFSKAMKMWRKEYSVDIYIRSSKRVNFVNLPKSMKSKKALTELLRQAYIKNKQKPFTDKDFDRLGLPPLSIFRSVFGSWNKALIAARLPILKKDRFSKKELLEILLKIHKKKGRIPRVTDLGGEYPSYPSFQFHFGTWEDALKTIGLKMSEGIYSKRARLWERKCEEIALILFKDAELQKSIKGIGRPDIYVPSKNIIIDAKLTSYDVRGKTHQQIKKYLKACDRMEFWCVHKTVETRFENVTYLYVEDLIKRLDSKKDFALIKSIKKFLIESDVSKEEFGIITKKEVLDELQKYWKNHKKVPSIKEFASLPNAPSVTTVRKLFGSFNKAIVAAGLRSNASGTDLKLNKNEILLKIKEYYDRNGDVPTLIELKIPTGSVRREFNNFSNALIAAGLKPNKKKLLKNEIINELRSMSGSLSGKEVKDVLDSHPRLPNWATLVKKLGGVDKIYKELGIKYNYKKEWTGKEVRKILKKVYNDLGYIPSSKKWAKIKTTEMPSDKAIYRLFKTWENAWSFIK